MQSLYISREISKAPGSKKSQEYRMRENQNVTYILKCSDGTLYTGWTNNMEKRLEAHNSGCGAKYTRGRTPVSLVYLELHDTKQEAMQREFQIKKLTRTEKETLIRQNLKKVQAMSDSDEARFLRKFLCHRRADDA